MTERSEHVDWRAPTRKEARILAKELRRELARGHELYHLKFEVFAVRRNFKDILIRVKNRPGVAAVHLTGKAKEILPWPWTFWYSDEAEAFADTGE